MAKAKTQVVSMKQVEEQMAAFASGAKARINQPAGNSIGIRNSKFTYKQEVIGDTLLVVAIDFVHVNSWYDQRFDPDAPAPPACFAISDDGVDMEPFDISPVAQHERCDGCPQNAWGSADQSRGKACKNQYRIACMEVDADAGEADIAFLTLPPTSQKNWDKYITGLERKLGKPPFGVVTQFGFDTDFDYPVITMDVESVIADAPKLAGIMARMDEVRKSLNEPFDVAGYEAPAKAAKKKPAPRSKANPKAKAKARPKAKAGKSKFS